MTKKTLLFFTGLSGSGKSYFRENFLQKDLFHNLRSYTTRPMRDGEQNGREYYFCDEKRFEEQTLVTNLFVNKAFWKPGMPKWLYGVPEFEVYNNLSMNLTYDVIQPCYVRQMIDWFREHHLDKEYDFKIFWFMPLVHRLDIIKKRQNMPNDLDVRHVNTCNESDFRKAGLVPDWIIYGMKNYKFLIRKPNTR